MCIAYNPTKIRLTKFTGYNNNSEIVCGIGNCTLSKRKLAFISVYLPPALTASALSNAVASLIDCVDKIKTTHADSIIFLGGDFNKKDISQLLTTFPELLPVCAGATRRGASLDEVYTNINNCIKEKAILKPLSKEDGTKSDHDVIAASFKLPKNKRNKKIEFKFRPISKKGTEKFGEKLLLTDWSTIERASASESALALNDLLQQLVAECFPEKVKKINSNDAPWCDDKVRKLSRKKARVYRSEGKSERFKLIRKECDDAVTVARKNFLGKVLDKVKQTRNSAPFYRTVNIFKSKEAPIKWMIQSMYPDMSDAEIAEIVAAFFNAISQEYDPLPCPK